MLRERGSGRGTRGAEVLLIGLLLAGCGSGSGGRQDSVVVAGATSAPRAPQAASRKTILFIGTSLTAGYGLDPDSAFPLMIARKVDSAGLPYAVTNAGVSGETTAALLGRLEWLLRGEFDVLVLETGANDGLRGIPVPTTRRNLDSIAARIRSARPNARVLLAQMEAPPNLGRQYTDGFRDMFPAVARRYGFTLVPFLLEGVAGRTGLNQADGIHPNLEGERIVAGTVWKALEPVLRVE